MESPITVLWGNIIHAFENVDDSSLKNHTNATNSGLLSNEIDYDNGKDKIHPPFAKIKEREIYLQETYLAHLWAFIYSVFVMYEEGIQKSLSNSTFEGSLNFDTPLLKRAKLLFDWSISLTSNYSDWNEKLPNPRTHNSEEEKFYSEKTNGIFQHAVAYLMFHEFAHLTQGHDSFFLGVSMPKLSEIERAELIQIENEADQYAFNMLIKEQDCENKRWINGVSILLVTCSALLITSKVQGVKQTSHPDLDDRILNVLQRLNLTSEESQFYCWYLCCTAMKFYFLKHGIFVSNNRHETAQELFFFYLDKLDEIKHHS